MFKDIELSKDIMVSLKQNMRFTKQLQSMELSVNVLTSSVWPTYHITEIIIPEQFTKYQSVFEEFYNLNYNNRRLSWVNSQGSCTLNYNHHNVKLLFIKGKQGVDCIFKSNNSIAVIQQQRKL